MDGYIDLNPFMGDVNPVTGKTDRSVSIEAIPEFSRVIGEYTACIRVPVGTDHDTIEDWCMHMDEDLLIHALREARRAGARSPKYVDAIIGRWRKMGIQSMQDLELHQQRWAFMRERRHAGA